MLSKMEILNNMKFLRTYETYNISMSEFLSDKPLSVKDTKFKGYLYHGTNVHPSKFELDEDYDANSEKGNGNVFEVDLPDGMLFLTNNFREASSYGKYVIPCEVKVDDIKVYKVDTNNPSVVWDDDFMGYGGYGMYSYMMNEVCDMVEVRGRNKSTFISFINVIVPRTDLSIEYYEL